ncbi:MAG: hypothetical protein BGN88_04190 [Clostridiales bacterium 43-6]|nr:MAG: hypothetical protein BGN88_04190 [Clostridiales bacterium 43-6]
MELIERYIYAVTKRVQTKQRDEIEQELRVLIDDLLFEKTGGIEPSAEEVEAVLNSLGDPREMAEKYTGKQSYLIGPAFYDTYLTILRIVLPIIVICVLAGTGIGLVFEPPLNIGKGIGEMIGSSFYAVFQGFSIITIVFAVNERYNGKTERKRKTWNINDLPQLPDGKSVIKKSEAIVSIVFHVLFLMLFTFIVDLIGIYSVEGQQVHITPVFNEGVIKGYLPLITLLFCVSIGKDCAKLVIGRWSPKLSLICVLLNIVWLIGAILIFSDVTVWNADLLNTYEIVKPATPVVLSRAFVSLITLSVLIDSVVTVIKGLKYKR